jgi:hypothetical protein
MPVSQVEVVSVLLQGRNLVAKKVSTEGFVLKMGKLSWVIRRRKVSEETLR